MTTNTTNSQAASFRAELLPILRNMYLHFEPDAIDDEICSVLDMIDAKLAQVEREAYSKGADDVRAHAEVIINRTVERAEKSESRLAEIQRGVEGLDRLDLTEKSIQGGWASISFMDLHEHGDYMRTADVLALLQPQGQADTSGLPD